MKNPTGKKSAVKPAKAAKKTAAKKAVAKPAAKPPGDSARAAAKKSAQANGAAAPKAAAVSSGGKGAMADSKPAAKKAGEGWAFAPIGKVREGYPPELRVSLDGAEVITWRRVKPASQQYVPQPVAKFPLSWQERNDLHYRALCEVVGVEAAGMRRDKSIPDELTARVRDLIALEAVS